MTRPAAVAATTDNRYHQVPLLFFLRKGLVVSSPLVRLLAQAESHLHMGHPANALKVSEQALRKAPRHPDALLLTGVCYLALEQAEASISYFERILAVDPSHGSALEHLGLAHLMLGRFESAESELGKAVRVKGAPASTHMRLGIAKLELGKPGEAIPHLKRALELQPNDPDAHVNMGRALAATGMTQEAKAAFRTALDLGPERAEPAYNLGVLSMQSGDLDAAQQWFEAALAVAPSFADARVNLAVVHQQVGRYDEALKVLQQAPAGDHDYPPITCEIARTLSLGGRKGEALNQFLRILNIVPEYLPAREGAASVCMDLGRTIEATEHLRILLRQDPRHPAAGAALANVLFNAGALDEATQVARECLLSDPSNAAVIAIQANVHIARGNIAEAIRTLEDGYAKSRSGELLGMLAYQLRQACDWNRWQVVWNELVPMLDEGMPIGSPFWLLCEPVSARQQLDYTRQWASARFGQAATRANTTVVERRDANARYRIGYLSSDLHDHATAYLIAEVIERHDRNRFEVFAYSYGPDDHGSMRARLKSGFEHFIDIAHDSDDFAAERIRADKLDLLIDLKGYTLGDRLPIMASRPCARQATWLGYPGTTGAAFVDYVIADPIVVPPSSASFYSERVARLPQCYQPNDRHRAVADPKSRAEYGLPLSAFVFCCFNQTYKITPDVFSVWMNLLRSVPDSVLWLLEGNSLASTNMAQAAGAAGIDPQRIVFAPRLPNSEHLARYRVADLALDTFPYTSHTTMSDALWCGCPAIALCGETFASRVSSSLLNAAELQDLVTNTLSEYEVLARRLVEEPHFRDEVKMRIAEAQERSALFDSARFAKDLEDLFIRIIEGG